MQRSMATQNAENKEEKPRQEIHTTPKSSEHRGEGQKNVRATDYGETGRGTEKYHLLSKTWPRQPPTQSTEVRPS